MALTRSFVLDDDDRFASLHEQWRHHVRRRFHRGPDPIDELVATITGLRPRSVLEVGAGSGQFAARLTGHLDGPVVVSDPSPTLMSQASDRALPAVVAAATALPFDIHRFDCVLARGPRWRADDIGDVLREIARVLGGEGVLVVSTATPDRDGHELDALVGCTLRRAVGVFAGDRAGDALHQCFERVVRSDVDHAMVFPSGGDLAAYLRSVPSRRHLADRVTDIEGPLRLCYRTSMFVASLPRG